MPLRNASDIKKIFSEAKQRRESAEKEEEERRLKRQINAQRRRENLEASEKLICEIRTKALIASGSGCYQLLVPKLKKHERQCLSSLGLSTRLLGDEQEFLENPYTEIFFKSRIENHYIQAAEHSPIRLEPSTEDHYLARKVKEKCFAWCSRIILGEEGHDLRVFNSWVVSWWELLFDDTNVDKNFGNQLVWLSSKDTQRWLLEIDKAIELAAMQELNEIQFNLMDKSGDLILLTEDRDHSQVQVLCGYFEALGYACTQSSEPYKLDIRWL